MRFLLLVALSFSTTYSQHRVLNDAEVSGTVQLFEHWVSNQMSFRNLPGLAIGVVYDQELVYARGFGFADIERKTPMTKETLFRMASVTKLFTATAIMILRDEGKLKLDDPVSTHLPWFKYRNRHAEGPPVTVRHLLTHTSGLPREAAFPYWTDHVFPTREQMIEAFKNQESVYEPATKYKYSNLGIAILGELVAAAAGTTYEQFIQSRVLKPLGMTGTFVFLPSDQEKRLATGYGRRTDDGKRRIIKFPDTRGIAPAANITSSIEDMTKFAMLQFREGTVGGTQILSGSTLREMQRVHWLQPSWTSGWGLGFSVSKSGDRTTFGHGGWVGGYRSQLTLSRSEKVAVVVLVNADDGMPGFFATRAMNMFAPVLSKVLSPPKPEEPKFDSSWVVYLGRYSDPFGWDSEVMVRNKKLVIYDFSYPPEEDPSGETVVLTPEGLHTFRVNVDGYGEKVVFEMGPDGKVQRVKTGENYMYPKK